jgi:curli biogenesis system outer membrane secretion channel CsgG
MWYWNKKFAGNDCILKRTKCLSVYQGKVRKIYNHTSSVNLSLGSCFVLSLICLISFSGCASTGNKTAMTSSSVSELSPYSPTGEEPRVVVFGFKNASFFESETLGPGVSMMFQTVMVRSRRFRVIDRENLSKILEEHKLSFSDITAEGPCRVGQLLEVDYIVTGKITEFGIKTTGTSVGAGALHGESSLGGGATVKRQKGTARIAIDVKFTDITTGQVIYMGTAIGEASSGNIGVGMGILTMTGMAAAATVKGGVQGFDETIAGKAARVAAYRMVKQIIEENVFRSR